MTEAASDAPISPVAPPAAQISGLLSAGKRRRLRLPIAAVLVAGFGTLMLAAVASVLILGLSSAGRNTFALLNDKADLAIDSVVVRVRHQLDPARDQITYLSGLIESGKLDPDDRQSMLDTLRGALAATPQVTGVAFSPIDQVVLRVGRVNGEVKEGTMDLSASPEMTKAMAEGKDRQGPYWAEPVWSPEGKTTLLTLRMPVRRDDRFLGLMIVAVALGDLSRFLSELYVDEGLSAFVLYDRDHVLAHQALRYKEFNFSEQAGLPLPRSSIRWTTRCWRACGATAGRPTVLRSRAATAPMRKSWRSATTATCSCCAAWKATAPSRGRSGSITAWTRSGWRSSGSGPRRWSVWAFCWCRSARRLDRARDQPADRPAGRRRRQRQRAGFQECPHPARQPVPRAGERGGRLQRHGGRAAVV